MKNRVVILLIPVAIIGIWIGLKLVSGVSDTHQLDNSTVQNSSLEDNPVGLDTSSSAGSNHSEQSPSSQVIKKELTKTLSDIRNAKSATQAQDLIAQARSDGNQYQAAYAEKDLTIHCSSNWEQSSIPGISFNEQAAEKVIAYCDGWYPSHTIEELEQEVSSRSDPAFNQGDLLKLLTATESINRSELINDLVNTARTPTELRNVFRAIERLNRREPMYSSLGAERQMSEREFREAMVVTELLMSCQLFSGCGADSLNMLTSCVHGEACPPGLTVWDGIAYMTSPNLFEQGELMYRYLLDRSGG